MTTWTIFLYIKTNEEDASCQDVEAPHAYIVTNVNCICALTKAKIAFGNFTKNKTFCCLNYKNELFSITTHHICSKPKKNLFVEYVRVSVYLLLVMC